MERVLVVSDDASWREALAAELEASGHEAQAVPFNSVESRPAELVAPLATIVVDLRGQAGAGARLGRVRRAVGQKKTHILAAMSPGQLARVDFAAGFDDFVADPVRALEVIARARQLRWRENATDAADILKAGEIVINLASCEVLLAGDPLSLTFQEYELLRHLVEHRGRVFTREQLLSELWGYNYYGGTRTVDVHVRRLRAKLGPEHEDLIQTVRNVGYRFARES